MAERVEVKRKAPPPDPVSDAASDRPDDGPAGAAPKAGAADWLVGLLASRSNVSRRRVMIMRTLAIIVDAIQLPLLPLLALGNAIDIVLDVVMMVICTWMLGWHLVFLPSFVTEGVPLLNVAPTWTLAVWWVTRGSGSDASQPAPPPEPNHSHGDSR